MVERPNHMLGPYRTEDEASTAREVVEGKFGLRAELVGVGDRRWVLVELANRDDAWKAMFNAYVLGYLDACKRSPR